jgi:diguanylate cyclase (GGDEF)-like protein
MVSGFAVWATHFIAMLAFEPALDVAYDPLLTIASLLIAVVLTGIGLAVAVEHDKPQCRLEGGAIIGMAIAAMHFTGMAAFEVPGRLTWSSDLVIAALLVGPALGALAFWVGLDKTVKHRRLKGAALFAGAVCAHHFTAMASVGIVPDPSVTISSLGIPPMVVAIATAIGGVLLVAMALISLEVDRRFEQRKHGEEDRMRQFANAAVEGLVITDGDKVVAANTSFRALLKNEDVLGDEFGKMFCNELPAEANSEDDFTFECSIIAGDGEHVPVEVVSRPISYDGSMHRVFAFRDLRERRKAQLEIHKLAYSDPLTELPNRRSFSDRLLKQIGISGVAESDKFVVVAIDLDRFKPINDTLGHGTGDKLLTLVAGRLATLMEDGDILARTGGDEFSVLLTHDASVAGAHTIASQIVDIVSRPYLINGHVVCVGASVGLAMFPEDGQTAEALMKNADLALYRAKESGRGTYAFFEQEMDAAMQRRRSLELELNRAVSRQEFELHYQPQLDAKGTTILGYEALIRWRHPTRGLVPPMEFIPLAEEIGLIVPIGEWALEAACKQALKWPDDVSIAVNLSPVQFANDRVVESVKRALNESGLDAHRLELEITETVLIKDTSATLETLKQLQDIGVSISMDDFGTGYSSLSYLRAFPFNKIKIDRSFIVDLDSSKESKAIVGAIIALGKSLGMTITAEGVETLDQAELLAAAGCDHLQGYYFGKPAAAGATATCLAKARTANVA